MDRMIYTAMTGANAAQHRQQLLSNNLANAATPGFRAELSTFRAVPVRGLYFWGGVGRGRFRTCKP